MLDILLASELVAQVLCLRPSIMYRIELVLDVCVKAGAGGAPLPMLEGSSWR